ncbi:hypothetical protein F2Q68_00033979 [Brassica cretica]|uniref:Uncharacterized protein n=1 Tax=Brassica cretica TaxID=69181 RepID=A0A8S9H802_BRACR|nr:hypothetical protein F2Q68_00033979 [Brassica cretica]
MSVRHNWLAYMLHTTPTVDKKALPSSREEFQFSLISKTWKSTGTRALQICTSRFGLWPECIETLHIYLWHLHSVLEYHMEFLETFGCIWSSKEVIRVIFGRALPGATT